MACTLDIDPVARAQIRELPPAGTAALAEAFEVLSLVLLTRQNQVDVLIVTWVDFGEQSPS